MGACATKFNVLDAGGAPVPDPKEDVAAAEGEAKDIEVLVAADDEAKRQSLGQMFKENESVEKDGKASEPVKQEDAPKANPQEIETVKSLEPVADAKDETEKIPAKDGQNPETSGEKKTEVVKSESCVEAEESQKIIEEKPVEILQLKPAKKVEDKPAVVNSESCVEAEESQKIIEEKPVEILQLKTAKKIEDKPSVVNSESCVEAEESHKIIEEKPVEIPKLDTLEKVEDNPAVEHLKTEEPEEKKMDDKSVIDKKPNTLDGKKTEEQKPTSDAENSKA